MNLPIAYTYRPVIPRRNGAAKNMVDRYKASREVAERIPVTSLRESVEEILIRLRSDPSYGLQEKISEFNLVPDDRGLQYEVNLLDGGGHVIICFGSNKRRLRRLTRHARARKRRAIVESVLFAIGDSLANLHRKIANCIRGVVKALLNKPIPQQEMPDERRHLRRKRGQWIVERNFQPQFA